jgi:alpha-1,2-mannosyltransferase
MSMARAAAKVPRWPWFGLATPEPDRLLRLVLLLWVVVAVAVSVRTIVQPTVHTVFPIFRNASLRWWNDQPLYSLTFVREVLPADEPDHFRYPPTTAVLMTPFAILGPRLGGIAWAWLSIGVFGIGLWRYASNLLALRAPNRMALFLTIALVEALRGLWNGQMNAVAVGLLLLGAAELPRRRWWMASTYLGLSVILKLTPLAPVLMVIAVWPRQLLGRFVVVLVLLALLPFLTRPPATVIEQYRLWSAHLSTSGPERWPGFRDAYTVYQAIRETGSGRPFPYREPMTHPIYRVIELLAGVGVFGWCLWVRWRNPGTDARFLTNLSLALGCCWLMLFGPSVEHAGFAFLAPFHAWALTDGASWRSSGRRQRGLLVASGVCVLVLGWGGLTRPLADAVPLVLTFLPVGVALFMVWLVGYSWKINPDEEFTTESQRTQSRKGESGKSVFRKCFLLFSSLCPL